MNSTFVDKRIWGYYDPYQEKEMSEDLMSYVEGFVSGGPCVVPVESKGRFRSIVGAFEHLKHKPIGVEMKAFIYSYLDYLNKCLECSTTYQQQINDLFKTYISVYKEFKEEYFGNIQNSTTGETTFVRTNIDGVFRLDANSRDRGDISSVLYRIEHFIKAFDVPSLEIFGYIIDISKEFYRLMLRFKDSFGKAYPSCKEKYDITCDRFAENINDIIKLRNELYRIYKPLRYSAPKIEGGRDASIEISLHKLAGQPNNSDKQYHYGIIGFNELTNKVEFTDVFGWCGDYKDGYEKICEILFDKYVKQESIRFISKKS